MCALALLSLGLALSMPSLASAEFSRPYLTQITGTQSEGKLVPFTGLSSLTVDPDPLEENVFVGTEIIPPGQAFGTKVVDEFDSANVFMPPQITGVGTNSLAFDDTPAPGKLVGAGEGEYVAVDNTTSATGGDVYRAAEAGQGSDTGVVHRVNASGSSEPFTCTEDGKTPEDIKGNELTGTGNPDQAWHGALDPVDGVAVDSGSSPSSAGDIYVINNRGDNTNPLERNQVDEFTSKGCFVRAITGSAVPEAGAFEQKLKGVAVDPTDGDLLVEARGSAGNEVSDEVIEFTESGEYLGQISGSSNTAPFGSNGLGYSGIAANSAGDLYVNVCERVGQGAGECDKSVVDELGPGAYFPDAVTGEVSGAEPDAMRLDGVVRGVQDSEKQDLEVAKCEFEYVLEEDFVKPGGEGGFHSAALAPCVLESGSSPVGQALDEKNYPVHGEAKGLEAGKVYEYRLLAASGGAHGGTQVGEVATFAAPAAPAIEGVSVGDVSSSFADFNAKIDPRGSDTTYQFEYIDAAAYEAALVAGAANPYAGGGSVPAPPGDLGAGDRYLSVGVQAGGLSPGTAYDYRVVASNGVNVSDSVDGVFATVGEGLRGLPDGRAYELVTPPSKGDAEDLFGKHNQFYPGPGAPLEINEDRGYASEDGDHFLLSTRSDFGPFPASGEDAYVFSRAAHGWTFQAVVSPSLGIQTVTGLLFDPADFSAVGVEDLVGAGAPSEHSLFDLDGPPGGPYATLASGGSSTEDEQVREVGGATDLSPVVLQSEDHKLPVCEGTQQALAETLDPGVSGLYEWSAARRCMSLVDVESQSEGGGLLSKCGAVLGRGQSGAFPGDMHGAVSGDGSKVFFTVPAPFNENDAPFQGPGCWKGGAADSPQLYMRLNGETTVEVSAPEKEGETEVKPPATYPAIYVGASEDGSRVFFLTRTELTFEAVRLGLHDPELYEYDTDTGKLARVSRGDSGESEGDVADVPAISADGSTVYFNAEGELAPHPAGAPSSGLYRYDTTTGTTTYVAPEQGYPVINGGKTQNGGEISRTAWYGNEVINGTMPSLELEAPYYTTPDGQFLLFGPYRYDAADGSIVCVMCNPNGSGPIAGASFTRSAPKQGNPASGPVRGMSENGEYVFFDTEESLVPQDTNGALDVYEWREGHGISLISSGQDPKNSYFLGSSSCVGSTGETVEGCNVFFGTHARLVPEDTDNSGDLYDARIGGGFGTSSGPPPCEGDACDNPPPPPLAPSPATFTSTSSGNVASEAPTKTVTKKTTLKCKKPKKLSHGKCVKPKKKSKAKKSAHTNRRAK